MNEKEVRAYLKAHIKDEVIIADEILTSRQLLNAMDLGVFHYSFVKSFIPKT